MSSDFVNPYYDKEFAAAIVRQRDHRNFIGGMWDEIGQLQFDFILKHGLKPDMRMIDIGCGCFRGGVHFIRYLNPGNYFGIDVSQALLDAGYDIELEALGLQDRLPRTNLNCNSGFDASMFGARFDVAIAQSVFTHLPLNQMKLCLTRAAGYVKPGGTFYATIFLSPPGHDWSKPLRHIPGGIVTSPDADPFHHDSADVRHCIAGLPWKLKRIVDWDHPRNQKVAIFTRTAD
jgi:SAM-dependent methyltransferase